MARKRLPPKISIQIYKAADGRQLIMSDIFDDLCDDCEIPRNYDRDLTNEERSVIVRRVAAAIVEDRHSGVKKAEITRATWRKLCRMLREFARPYLV